MTSRTGGTVEVDNRDLPDQIRELTAQRDALKRENVRLLRALDEAVALLRRAKAGGPA